MKPTQDQFDRASEWVAENYKPPKTDAEYTAMLRVALVHIQEIDAANDAKEAALEAGRVRRIRGMKRR